MTSGQKQGLTSCYQMSLNFAITYVINPNFLLTFLKMFILHDAMQKSILLVFLIPGSTNLLNAPRIYVLEEFEKNDRK